MNKLIKGITYSFNQSRYAATFVTNFTHCKMDIQAAGVARIPAASLSDDGMLTIDYARKGKIARGE